MEDMSVLFARWQITPALARDPHGYHRGHGCCRRLRRVGNSPVGGEVIGVHYVMRVRR